jgi:hypothetical protein
MAWGGVAINSLKFHPSPSTPCRQAIPETTIRPFQRRTTCRVGNLRPSLTPLDTPRRMPLIKEVNYSRVRQVEIILYVWILIWKNMISD